MNLLTDPLFRVETHEGQKAMSLPKLMEALGRDEITHLIGIQRHQEDAFHVFLCYLAGAILARNGEKNPEQSEEFWRSGLRQLAGGARDDAWTLVVEDLSRPAFMQPPLPKNDHAGLKPIEPVPNASDALDLLPTAKNHDVKRARATQSGPAEWIYALVSLQTMSGFFGRGNPGIARMNSGFGNRSIVELVRTRNPGGRWCDAVVRLAQHRSEVLDGPWGYDPQGTVLIWTIPWDGVEGLRLSQLDPFFIEICRRVRLQTTSSGIIATSIPSQEMRIDAKDLRGVVGDPWLPVDLGVPGRTRRQQVTDEKALTVSPEGLTPDLLRRIIFGEQMRLTALQRPLASWRGPLSLMVSVLVRGQGTTEGFHEHAISIPPQAPPKLFGSPQERDRLASLARTAIDYAGIMQRSVLRVAIFVYMEGGPEKVQFDRDSARAWWVRFARRFDSLWSQEYFPWLWASSEDVDQQKALDRWALILRDHALTVLQEAQKVLPGREGRRWRSRVRADRAFWGALYHANNFPFLKEVEHERRASG